MKQKIITCPKCGHQWPTYDNPLPTVDVVIARENEQGNPEVLLILRKNPPPGWALPGGFVDTGETVEEAAVREAREETGLQVTSLELLGVYSRPDRDPRHHTISTVFIARAEGVPQAADDAAEARFFPLDRLPENIAFDHREILEDFLRWRQQRENGC